MLQNLTGWHALIVLAVIVLIFGAARLPALARSVGQSMRILKSEVADREADASAAPEPTGADATTAVPHESAPRHVAAPADPRAERG